jgi:hypothetical protein
VQARRPWRSQASLRRGQDAERVRRARAADLDGRVEDIRLEWSHDEEELLLRGSNALNITMTPGLRTALVEDAYSNAGLLQRLAEQVCIAENIGERCGSTRALDAGPSLTLHAALERRPAQRNRL